MNCKIFIPITGSDTSKIVTDRAVKIAAFLNAKIVAIHVLDQEALAKLQRYKIFIEEESFRFGESLKRDAEKYLEYAKRVASHYHVDLETVLLEGDPYHEMHQYIKNDNGHQKFVMIAREPRSDNFIDSFGSLEKRLLRSELPIIIAGEE
ncbi:MAG: universal stress protein [Brevinema sp.]